MSLATSVGVTLAARAAPPRSVTRVVPLPDEQWTPAMRSVVSDLGVSGPTTNDVRTLARHPELFTSAIPFLGHIARSSDLPPRHRELLALRAAWLCRAEYVWAARASIAQKHGLRSDELRRIAQGPDGWDPFESALLRAVDELHVNSFITDGTWRVLAARYDRRQLLDAVFTIAGYTMLSSVLNAFGVEPDARPTVRLPDDVPYRLTAAPLDEAQIRLPEPRIPLLTVSELTPEARKVLDPSSSGRLGGTAASYGHHLKLYEARQKLSDYLRVSSPLARVHPIAHESVILRTALLNRSRLEWAAHQGFGLKKGMTAQHFHGILAGPTAPLWDAVERALLQATDELQNEATITPSTWAALAARYEISHVMDIAFTAAGYRFITSGQITLGLQSEPPQGIPPVWPERPR